MQNIVNQTRLTSKYMSIYYLNLQSMQNDNFYTVELTQTYSIYVTMYYGPEIHHYHRANVVRACVDMFGSQRPPVNHNDEATTGCISSPISIQATQKYSGDNSGGSGTPDTHLFDSITHQQQICTAPAGVAPGATNWLGTPLGHHWQ